jgi:DNA polymerase, archaea type
MRVLYQNQMICNRTDDAGIDSVLKWMLVTCFGYTGYRNAKFGQIQVHERITEISRELLMQIKKLAEDTGFEVLHGIVDCLWVIGEPISEFKEAVERDTGILTEVDSYDWITFLPMADGSGAYNRYFGRLDTGKMKIRGVMARKGDTPEYVRRMQQELFDVLAKARSLDELRMIEPAAREVCKKYMQELEDADVRELVSSQGEPDELFAKMCRGFGSKGISETGITFGYGLGDRICGDRCGQVEGRY